jgi:hypothetical protein
MNWIAIFGLVILLSSQAQAQTVGNNLRGVNQFKLLFQPLDGEAKECQLTEALIHDAFMYPASGDQHRHAIFKAKSALRYTCRHAIAGQSNRQP